MQFSLAFVAVAAAVLPVVTATTPEMTEWSPWQNDLHSTSDSVKVTATVNDDDIKAVRVMTRFPDGSVSAFEAAIETSSDGDVSTWEFEVDTSDGAGKYGYKVRMRDSDQNFVLDPEDDFIEFVVANDAGQIVELARTAIEDVIDDFWRADPQVNMAAKFARHGFHDCVGGCDGCVDMGDGHNGGLEEPIAALEPVVDMFTHHGVTRADIWVLAALEGIRGTQDEDDPDSHREFTMDWVGRPTCEDTYPGEDYTSRTGPERHLPSSELTTEGLLEFFADEFDFDDRDTVAIMGVHDLGILQRKNSGFDGENGWHGKKNVFTNLYYDNLIGGDDANASDEELLHASDWVMTFVDNTEFDGIDDRWQWNRGIDLDQAVMINSDMAIARDLADYINATTGEVVGCQMKECKKTSCNACPAASTIGIVKDYKFDQALFFEEFESAFKRMLNTGCSTCESCLSPPCVMDTTARRNLRSGDGN